MGSIKTENIDVAAEKESGSTRFYFWMASIDMAKDYPFGAGASGFVYYSPFYIPESVDTGGSRNRAVHSTWFEVLSEIGYLGLFSFVGMIFYSFSTIVKTAKKLKNEKNIEQYFKVVSIGCALFCFIISMTFLNRFRAEILYWLILFSAVAYNVFYIKFSDTTYIGEK
jgi:O-antigen ligase